jgi:hypothetical protein
VTGQADRLEAMRTAYRTAFGEEMPEPEPGAILLLGMQLNAGLVLVDFRIIPPGGPDPWLGSSL